jgi:hypothetical protein
MLHTDGSGIAQFLGVGVCALPCATVNTTPAIRLYNLDGLGRDGPRYTVTTHVLPIPKLWCCKATAASRTCLAGARAGLRSDQPQLPRRSRPLRSALSAVRTAAKLTEAHDRFVPRRLGAGAWSTGLQLASH